MMFIGLDKFELLGALGASMILFGFYRTSIGRWTNKSIWYELDNLFGAGFLTVYNLSRHAQITVVLDVIWVIVAFRGITSIAERQRKTRKRK